ncbi:MAG: hypothetical protein MJ085_02585 [Clostridia bacterium]|nr:hypothetical protein [Clostridia bacterium]
MDIKAKITEIVEKIKGDPKLMENFKKDPEKTIEGVAGVNIPDGMADKIVDGVKAKLAGDKISDGLKKLF